MAIAYRTFPEERLLVVSLRGIVSREENTRAFRQMLAEDVFAPTDRLLIDVVSMTESEVRSRDLGWIVSSVARRAGERTAPLQVAICAAEGSFGYAMARIFDSFASITPGISIVALDGVDLASRALGLKRPGTAYLAEVADQGTGAGA